MRGRDRPGRTPLAPRLDSIWRRYSQESRRPLYCLLFLFPLVATYEFGSILVRPTAWPERQLVAHSLIQRLLSWFGASGFWLPAVALVLTLLLWHILGRHPWRVRGRLLPLMVVESLVLTVPLFVLGQVMMEAARGAAREFDLREQIVLALGAGIYEELVFRLYLIVLLMRLFEGVLKLPDKFGGPLAIGVSALIFAACHFAPIGREPLAWKHFLLLVLAGGYLGQVFVWRGLGIAAGCHVSFNLILLAWEAWGG